MYPPASSATHALRQSSSTALQRHNSPTKAIFLRVQAQSLPDNKVRLHFSLRDTGIGIAPEELQILFQPFNQADVSNTRRYGGTGLGLAISKRLCELMGGEIWVDSEKNVGSTFHFTLIAPVSTRVERTATTHAALLHGKSALIVEHSAANRAVLEDHLTTLGLSVTGAASAVTAIEIVQRNDTSFDVALIDAHLPSFSGLALVDALRELKFTQPVILLAPVGEVGTRMRADQAGARTILHKPVKPSELERALVDILVKPVAAHRTRRPPAPAPVETPHSNGRSLRILLAEDNLVNQKVALRMLARLGLQADVVTNGEEAVAAVHNAVYDVILMDVQMPEMDGLEATRRIRAAETLTYRPFIIAMTAAAMQADQDRCIAAGMDDFISKPTRLEELSAKLKIVPSLAESSSS